MAFRGERFHIPLEHNDDDEYDAFEQSAVSAAVAPDVLAPSPTCFIKDIKEHSPPTHVSPTAPTLKAAAFGFPAHKRRQGISRFKQARTGQDETTVSGPSTEAARPPVPQAADSNRVVEDGEKAGIHEENQARLALMSDKAIAEERAELLNGLSPSLVQRLLRRADIDTDTGLEDFPKATSNAPSNLSVTELAAGPGSYTNSTESGIQDLGGSPNRRIAFESSWSEVGGTDTAIRTPKSAGRVPHDAETHNTTLSVLDDDASVISGDIHFPHPPVGPELDPSSPSFLTDLHEKYFPSLPTDPSKLAWMADPCNIPSYESSYSPNAESIPASALRFSFRGSLIPPRTALSIPVTQGLHHHGDAPESAGYTIPELAHLARSSFPAQRCVAFQTLGRIMYRLGRGEYGAREDDLAGGLWKCIEQGRVLDTLHAAADKMQGHMSSKAYATEALWLWQKGGGLKVKAV